MDTAQFINQLDLNSYEKEIILFLTSIDHANAYLIYKKTKVPKGRIYSVLNDLVDKGFISIIPTNPKKYAIEDIKSTLYNYLESKKLNIDKKINEIEQLDVNTKQFQLEKNTPSVYTFAGREQHIHALISLRNKAKKQLIQVAPLFIGTFSSNTSIYRTLERGVKIQVIVKKITKENKNVIKQFLKAGADIRSLNSPDLINFLIKDNDEFILGLEDYRMKEERINLLSKNKALLIVLREYFEKLWKKAKKINEEKL
ncbi:hypothetical protein HYY69_05695 [Candidatus Woesearchaeota archaeon]|nr:hypothetical protein [Candidatus Woesearchaeota archaeon]